MDTPYKQLTSADVEQFRELIKLFGEAFEEPETYQGDPPSNGYLQALLAKEHVIALAAFSGEQVVGGLVAYMLDKFEQERSEIYIYDLAVDERHRRQGIAIGLINELRRIALERGAYVIFVQADPEDEPAVRLYEKLGTREDVYHFDIRVEGIGSEKTRKGE